MKIAVFGILPFSQLIKDGFSKLGHEISNENPDIIFSNDPRGYKEAILLKKKIFQCIFDIKLIGYTLAHAKYTETN